MNDSPMTWDELAKENYEMKKRIKELEEVLSLATKLSEIYLANPLDQENEFVSCITPEKKGKIHKLWRKLYQVTHTALEDV